MPHLKNKSETNTEAARLLHSRNLYPSAIHSAYYACLQIVKHIIIKESPKTPSEVEDEIKTSPESTHEYLINRLTISLREDGKDYKTFNNNINQLKKLRVESDYSNVLSDSSKSKNSLDLNEIIIKHLKAIYKT